MEPELKRQLEEIHALARDNHHMLRAIRRTQWYSFLAKIVFWAVIIFAPFYLYHQYVGPYLNQFQANPTGATLNLFGLPSSEDIQKLINSYKSGN